MTSLTKEAVADLGVKPRDAERSKNFFALGLISWMYTRPVEPTLDWIESRSAPSRWSATPTWPPSRPGTPSARPPSCSTTPSRSTRPSCAPGTYTNINGNTALAWGLVAAGQLSGLPLFLGCVPDHAGVGHPPRAVQAQELRRPHPAGRGRDRRHRRRRSAPPSAATSGITTTSGPGIALKGETMGLAVSLELPLLIIDIQRGGPSTGLPTKTEAADLLQAMYGRHGESPAPDRGRLQPVALLRGGHRGGPHRAQVPHAGHPAVRRLPGQRLRAVAPPRRRRPARHLRAVRHRAQPHRRRRQPRVLALPPRPRDAGPALGDARHARPHAPHRRHREGGRAAATSPTSPPTTSAWSTCGPPRSPASPATSRSCDGRRRRRRRRDPRARLGLDLGRHQRRGRPLPGPRPEGGQRPPRPPQPVPPQPGRGAAAATRGCSCPR